LGWDGTPFIAPTQIDRVSKPDFSVHAASHG